MTPTTLRRISAQAIEMPLFEPFRISRGSQDAASNVLVTVELADGTLGIGEAAPLPRYNGETQAGALQAVEQARPAVEGADAAAWRRIAADLRAAIPASGAARCAIEAAMLDALTRRAGMPLAAFFGGCEASLETDVTVPVGSVSRAAEAAAARHAQGFRALKIKVGAHAPLEDAERVAAARDAAPGAKIRLDANAALSAGEAIALLDALRARGVEVELFEQPVARGDWDGLRRVADQGVAVALDESVVTAADALEAAARLGPPHVVNIKLMKAGIAEALDVAAIARAAGMRRMIGGMVESVLAMTTSACFAAGLGGFDFIDLDTSWFIASSPFEGGFEAKAPVLDLRRIRAGHGVTARRGG